MTTLVIILLSLLSAFVVTLYTGAVCIKSKGIPYSISATFYAIKHRYWFCFTMILTAWLLMPAILEISKPNTEFLAFLACIGMIGVGFTPNYKGDAMSNSIHCGSAVLTLLSSQLWVACNAGWVLLPVWLAYLTYTGIAIARQKEGGFLYKFYQTKPMFWVEIAALISTYLASFINIIM